MSFDINTLHVSGTVSQIRPIQTRSGIAMTQFRIQSWKEEVRCVAFRELANQIVDDYENGDRIEVKGRMQSSNWEKDGVRVYSYQCNVQHLIENGSQSAESEPSECRRSDERSCDSPNHCNSVQDYQGGPF